MQRGGYGGGDGGSDPPSSDDSNIGGDGHGPTPPRGRGQGHPPPQDRNGRPLMSLPAPLQYGKSGITPFTGKANKLNPFLQDISMLCRAHGIADTNPLMALVIFQHCAEEIKAVLRNLPDADLLDPTKIISMLKQSFGVKCLIKVANDFRKLVNLTQPKGPYLHQHWVRFKSLVMAIMRSSPIRHGNT